jgi:YbbR domain-containing protein
MIAFFRRYIFHNFALKLMSVLLASSLWLINLRDEQPAEVAVRAPILFQHVPAGLEVSSESIPEAQIRVRGPERVIRHLSANEVQAELDLTGTGPRERTFDLTPQQVRHPREVAVMQIIPGQLHLSLDTRLTREVEIRPRLTGTDNLPAGEQVVKIDFEPPRITITGPRRHVEKIDFATTDPIDITGTLGTEVFTTSVYVPDPLVQVEQATSIRVTVVVQKAGTPPSH